MSYCVHMVCNQDHNINNYVDQIKCEIDIVIDPSKIFKQESCTKNAHFLSLDLEKTVFHKNLGVFKKNIQMRMLGIPCLFMIPRIQFFPMGHIILFLLRHLINSIGNNNNYLLGDVLPYLEAFQSSRLMSPHLQKTTLSVVLNILVRRIPNIECYLMIVVIIVMFHIV